MSPIVNTKALTYLRGLIRAGKVDRESKWSAPTLADCDGDMKAFAQLHLAIHTDEKDGTAARYGYPVARDGKVYRSGVVAAKQRAAGQGQDNIAAVADRLWKLVDKKDKTEKQAAEAAGVHPDFAADFAFYVPDKMIEDLQGLLDAGLPVQLWVQVIPYGVYHDTREPKDWAIYANNSAEMVDTFNADGNDLPADKDHGTTVVGGDGQAYGWIIALMDRGMGIDGGLWALVEWLPAALPLILSGGYRYISGDFRGGSMVGGVWLPSRLRAIAITNTPVIKGMKEILASETPSSGADQSTGGVVPNEIQTTKGENDVEKEKIVKLCADLGITPQDDKEDTLLAAISGKVAETAKLLSDQTQKIKDLETKLATPLFEPAFLEGIGMTKDAPTDQVKAKILAEMGGGKSETSKLASELASIKADLETERQKRLSDRLQNLVKDGYVAPAELEPNHWFMKLASENPTVFEANIADRLSKPPMLHLGPNRRHEAPSSKQTDTDEFKKLAASAGLTAEDIKAYEEAHKGEVK